MVIPLRILNSRRDVVPVEAYQPTVCSIWEQRVLDSSVSGECWYPVF